MEKYLLKHKGKWIKATMMQGEYLYEFTDSPETITPLSLARIKALRAMLSEDKKIPAHDIELICVQKEKNL